MSHKTIEIKKGAFVVSDAHYSHRRPQLLNFFQAIQSKQLLPTQIILMGDIFDTLFGGIKQSYIENQELINVINDIALDIDIIYLEGNHDFSLDKVFKNVEIFPLTQQPLLCSYQGKKIFLAHGDFDGGLSYKFYTLLIRNRLVLFFLGFLNSVSNNVILKKLDQYLAKKDDCKEIEKFKNIITRRLENKYECDYFIEGHFHQNKGFEIGKFRYINLAAFACNQRYFIVKSSQDKELLGEQSFSKGI